MEAISHTTHKPLKRLYLATWGIIILGLILTTISFLNLCSEECAEGHNYRLFGQPFEVFGVLFFGTLATVHFFARNNPKLAFVQLLLFASAIGAEILFILIQKYQIGIWCPVCLTIASVVTAGFICQYLACKYYNQLNPQLENQRKPMENIWTQFSHFFRFNITNRHTTSFLALAIGFIVAFFGVVKHDELQAAQDGIKDKLVFGNAKSDIEIYLFTDWACPACRKLEPTIETLVPMLMKNNKFIFVDHVIHPETLNYTPYNLSFMIKNKPQYFKLRHMLDGISKETKDPSDDLIAKAASKLGVTFHELGYADVDMGTKYFKSLGEKFKVKGTPTMVIINSETKKGKKLVGSEISKENINKSIEALKG